MAIAEVINGLFADLIWRGKGTNRVHVFRKAAYLFPMASGSVQPPIEASPAPSPTERIGILVLDTAILDPQSWPGDREIVRDAWQHRQLFEWPPEELARLVCLAAQAKMKDR